VPLLYPFKVPTILQKLYPGFEWNIRTKDMAIYLTFDDGPHPEITPWVLQELDRFGAKATFFCVGENAERHPQILDQIVRSEHSLGNHTHNHIKGWKTGNLEYVKNTLQAAKVIPGKLFRPPYGRITRQQGNLLKAQGFRIVMWNLLSCDYLQTLDRKKSLEALVKYTAPGSIIVFHDSAKARENLEELLPQYLEAMTKKQFQFRAL
jgi:peptidoglycan/xylan/chitin deacetylase (PgdA/CDA1 family)